MGKTAVSPINDLCHPGRRVKNDTIQKAGQDGQCKPDRLLKVFAYPEMPLHNNPAELAARRRIRKRDISFGPRTPDGVAAWDTFMTLAATARQLGVNFYAYSSCEPPCFMLIRVRNERGHMTLKFFATEPPDFGIAVCE